jgi:hypothetical protein
MITWSEIIAECGEFRKGFVNTYLKHKGEETDERDESNRVVKVTESSFARHTGIPQQTFNQWVKEEVLLDSSSTSAKQARGVAANTRAVKNLTRKDPAALADAVLSAGPEASGRAFHEIKLRRAGVDTSKANKKAANAWAHQQAAPIRQAIAVVDAELCIAALNDATTHLQTALNAGALNSENSTRINAAHEAFQFALTEALFNLS